MQNTKTRRAVAGSITRPLLKGAFAVATTAIVSVPAPALADTFLKLDGIEGESTSDKHKGEIDILSFTQSFINSVPTSGGGSGKGKVNCGEITLMKNIDKSSPQLLKTVITGKHIRDGVLSFQTTSKAATEYYTIKMKEVFVTELTQTDAADPNRIFEKVVLSASDYEFEYTPQDSKGGTRAPIKLGYNCETTETR